MILNKNVLLDYVLRVQEYKLEDTTDLGLIFDTTTNIVYNEVKDYLQRLGLGNLYVYTENKKVIIGYDYNKNSTKIVITIKRKKEGVKKGYFNDYGLYVITDLELSSNDLSGLLQAKNNLETEKENNKNDFLTELQKHDLSINDFIDLYKRYDKLDYKKKMEIEKSLY